MQYKYRWIYAIAVSVSLFGWGFFSDLKPKYTHIEELKRTAVRMQHELQRIREFNASQANAAQVGERNLESSEQADFLAKLLVLLREHGLKIERVDLPDNEIDAALGVRFLATANFRQLTEFVAALVKQPVWVGDFLYKIDSSHQFHLTMTVFWQANPQTLRSSAKPPDFSHWHDPFCFATHGAHFEQVAATQSVPLSELQMIGYLGENERRLALITTPTNQVLEVKRGSVLGAERGVVIEVERDHVVVALPNKNRVRIKL